MLTIRLARIGKKNRPQFRIMLQEHTVAPGGTHVEILGSYDPQLKKAVLKEDRIKYWAGQGVKISDTAYNLFVSKGVLSGEKRKVKLPAKKAESVPETTPEAKKETAEALKAETVPAEAKPEEKKEEAKPKKEASKAQH